MTIMSPLSNLPTELLDHIVSPHLPTPDLSNLSQTSKGFRAYCLPKLYNSLSVSLGDCRPAIAAIALLRSVLANPTLGPCIHHLDLHSRKSSIRHTERIPPSVLDEALSRVGLSQPKEWKAGIFEGEIGPTIGLLMLHTPNLETLKIELPELERLGSNLSQVLEHSINPDNADLCISKFENLRTVELAGGGVTWPDGHHKHPNYYQPGRRSYLVFVLFLGFVLPRVEKLDMHCPGPIYTSADIERSAKIVFKRCGYQKNIHDDGDDGLPNSHHLKRLKLVAHLYASSIPERTLYRAPLLTHLDLTFWIMWGYMLREVKPLNLGSLNIALSILSPTLQSLRLCIDNIPLLDFQNRVVDAPRIITESLGPLTEFHQLKKLEISPLVLCGVERLHPTGTNTTSFGSFLPSDLQVLWLRDDLYDMVYQDDLSCIEPAFSALATDILQSGMSIKQFFIHVGGSFPRSESLKLKKAIIEMGKDAGVHCTVCNKTP